MKNKKDEDKGREYTYYRQKIINCESHSDWWERRTYQSGCWSSWKRNLTKKKIRNLKCAMRNEKDLETKDQDKSNFDNDEESADEDKKIVDA